MSGRCETSGSAGQPLVTVITPTLNRPDFLRAALDSVAAAAENLRGEVEVVVVNDGGQPASPTVAVCSDLLRIKLIESTRHAGAAAARNAGITAATGKYIAFLDDDDLFHPDHLAYGCDPLERDQADFVYLGALVSERRIEALPIALSGYPLKAYSYEPNFLMVANYLHTGSVIVRNFRDTPVRFDISLAVCEDWDLWLALTRTLRYRVAFIDRVTSIYHQVRDAPGLVSGAQLESPSKFALARIYINDKWPSRDPLVVANRRWMAALEQLREELIGQQLRMPNLLFDEILSYLHGRFIRRQRPDHRDIGRFFGAEVQANEGAQA
jgi:glycosyltransferase involved in cell wall biosynthesis